MARREPKGTWRLVLLLIAALVLWALDQRRDTPSSKRPPASERTPAGKPAPSAKPAVRGGYEEFAGCRLEEHRQNDGDSFHVRLPDGRVEQFRLYYVDAPESAFRRYAGGEDNHDRIADQADDFGITSEQAVEIGKRAKQRVHDTLARGTFTLHTAWDDPFGDRRYHAFVRPSSGPWLDEMLVREGLVRIHTKPADLPDGTPVKQRLHDLRELEKAAKRSKQGAWGLAGSR